VGSLGQPYPTWPGEVRDAGEPGFVAGEVVARDSSEQTVTLRLVGYDLQQRTIDVYTQARTENIPARFAGPYVVYQRTEDWVVYDTRDGSSRSIQPFEGM
jgi:hypothetical protein